MRIFLDTNVLFSAALNPEGTVGRALYKAVVFPNVGLICQQNIDELRRIFLNKIPHKIRLLDDFLANALPFLKIVPIPENPIESESLIRDKADRPIFRAALIANADILISGDKDFLESGITQPRILTPADFIQFQE